MGNMNCPSDRLFRKCRVSCATNTRNGEESRSVLSISCLFWTPKAINFHEDESECLRHIFGPDLKNKNLVLRNHYCNRCGVQDEKELTQYLWFDCIHLKSKCTDAEYRAETWLRQGVSSARLLDLAASLPVADAGLLTTASIPRSTVALYLLSKDTTLSKQ